MKKIILLLQFPIIVLSQQKIKIVDSETSNPISNARLISNQNIYYSNDDGYILLPENTSNWEVSAFGYVTENLQKHPETVILKPKYQNIDEVKIVSIDFKEILKNVSDNYSKIYYNKPQLYDINIKQRSFENNQMKLLMIADGKFWSRDGKYNAKESINNKFDNFLQIQLDHLRYLKSEAFENFIRTKKQNTSQDNVGDMFFSYEVWRTLQLAKIKKAKTSGKLLNDDGEEQEISFMIKTKTNMVYKGNLLYNKKDNAITHFELNFNQSQAEPHQLVDENGVKYKRQLGDGKIIFDFYKQGDQYFPTKISLLSEKAKTITDEKSFEYRSAREIIFKTFQEPKRVGVDKPIELNKAYWANLKVSQDKGEILLSKEEEEFINEKSNEIQD